MRRAPAVAAASALAVAGYDVSGLTGQARVIAEAMQRYGLIVAPS